MVDQKPGAQATLRVELSRAGASPGTYALRIEFRAPNAPAAELLADSSAAPIALAVEALAGCEGDLDYTRTLSQAIFGDGPGAPALLRARTVADLMTVPLRIRVAIGANAPELQAVRWELLGDPTRGFQPFARGERTSLARWTQPRGPLPEARRHRRGLRSLALIANPRLINDRPLALPPIDVAAYSAIVTQGLDRTRLRLLTGERASLDALESELKAGCDILFLTCHGALRDEVPNVYLERANQQAEIVDGRRLAERIAALMTEPPRLAVLASCDSLGDGHGDHRIDGRFFSSLAAQLARVGVPAVIGMQGPVDIETARQFLVTFLDLLMGGQQIEAAVGGARMAIERQDDWWVPALLLSVEDSGLVIGGPAKPYRNWAELIKMLNKGRCTPILGPDAIEQLSNRRIARYFETKLRYPILHGDQGLPRVAQQLKVENGQSKPGSELENFYREEVIGRDSPIADDCAEIGDVLRAWAKTRLAEPAFNSYRELAKLKIPVFVTTNPDDLLTDALQEQDKDPQVLVCPWKGKMAEVQAMPPDVEYSERRPVVYHLFGHLSKPQSVVLTEDDFFDHLIWLSTYNRLIPSSLMSRFSDTSLMFLGFHLEDWEFRILLRSIAKLPSAAMLSELTHVAVQLDPSGLNADQQAHAEQALVEFFNKTEVKLDIYWGTVEDFLRELRRQLPAREREREPKVAYEQHVASS